MAGLASEIARMIEDALSRLRLRGDQLPTQIPGGTVAPATGTTPGAVALSDANPEAPGAPDPGTATDVSRSDHVHTPLVVVRKNSGGSDLSRRRLNLIEGTNVTITATDDGANDEIDVTIASSGGVSDGDKGDITVSGSGATWTIDNDAVTFAKIQNITTARLLGRTTAGSGDVEEISVGTGLSLSAGSLASTALVDPTTTIGDIIIRNASNVTARLGIGTGAQVLGISSGVPAWVSVVTSVGASSPLSSSGGTTPTISFATQAANTVLSGPTTGAAAAPTFRALVDADIPADVVRRASSATAGRVAYWSGANQITHDADLTYDGSTNILSGVNVSLTGYAELSEIAEPSAPASAKGRLYAATSSLPYYRSDAYGSLPLGSLKARISHSANQAVTSSTVSSALTLDTEIFDTGGLYDAGTPDRLTIPVAGLYLVGGGVRWASNATGFRRVILRVNASTVIALADSVPLTGNETHQSVATIYEFAASDYIRLFVAQTSGGNLNVEVAVAPPALWAIGPL